MSETATSKTKKRPVLIWFGLFAAYILGMVIFLDTSGIDNELLANALMLGSMAFIVKAGLNAMHNAGKHGQRGSPMRNYLTRMLVLSVAYVGSLFAATQLIDKGDPITPVSIAIALVPGLAVAGYFWAIARLIIELKDEFLRMLQIRQALIATGISLSAASAWGFLESFEQAPHIDAYWWPIVWFFGLGVGAVVNKLNYGTTGEVC